MKIYTGSENTSYIMIMLAGVLLSNSADIYSTTKNRKIRRLNSSVIFPKNDEKRSCMTPQEYVEMVNKFSEVNGIYPRLGDRMKREYDEYIANAKSLGNIFGYKQYPTDENKDSIKFISIDISFPNLERVIKKHIKNCVKDWEKIQEENPDTEPIQTHANLKYLLKKIDEILARDEHSLDKDEVNWFIRASVGNDDSRIFKIAQAEYMERFKQTMENILKNKSGFQRVMSILLVYICNQMKLLPFKCKMPKDKKNIIIWYNTAGSAFNGTTYEINYNIDGDFSSVNVDHVISLEETAIYHEMSHAYHYMIGHPISTGTELRKHSWISNFSTLNSSQLDFVDSYFPMLKSKNMDPVVKELNNILKPREEIISKYFSSLCEDIQRMIRSGFGSIFFEKVSKEEDLKYENLINKFLPEIFYISKFTSDSGEDSLWNNYEEKITMQGSNLFLSNGSCFIIEDRQHEQIYAVRKKNPGNSVGPQECYRVHDVLAPGRIKDEYDPLKKENRLDQIINSLFKVIPWGNWKLSPKLEKLLANQKLWEPSESNIKYEFTSGSNNLSDDDFSYDESFAPKYFNGKRPLDSYNENECEHILEDIESNQIDISTSLDNWCARRKVIHNIIRATDKDVSRKILKYLINQNVHINSREYYEPDFFECIETGFFENEKIISILQKYINECICTNKEINGKVLFNGLKKIDFEKCSKEDLNKIIEKIDKNRNNHKITVYDVSKRGILNVQKLQILLPYCDILDLEVAEKINEYLKSEKAKVTPEMMIPLVQALSEEEKKTIAEKIEKFSFYEMVGISPYMGENDIIKIVEKTEAHEVRDFSPIVMPAQIKFIYLIRNCPRFDVYHLFYFLEKVDFSNFTEESLQNMEEAIKETFDGYRCLSHLIINTDEPFDINKNRLQILTCDKLRKWSKKEACTDFKSAEEVDEYIKNNKLEKLSTPIKILTFELLSDEEAQNFVEENKHTLRSYDYVSLLDKKTNIRTSDVFNQIFDNCSHIPVKVLQHFLSDDSFLNKIDIKELVRKIPEKEFSDISMMNVIQALIQSESKKFQELLDEIVAQYNTIGKIDRKIFDLIYDKNLTPEVFFKNLNNLRGSHKDFAMKKLEEIDDVPLDAIYSAIKIKNAEFLSAVLNKFENKNISEEQLADFLCCCLCCKNMNEELLKILANQIQKRVKKESKLHNVLKLILNGIPADLNTLQILLSKIGEQDNFYWIWNVSNLFKAEEMSLKTAIELYRVCNYFHGSESDFVKILREKTGVTAENFEKKFQNFLENNKITEEDAQDFYDDLKYIISKQ